MIPISMRGFAEVCAAPDNRKVAKLKSYKFKKSGESKGRSNYYVKALSAIRHHHHGDHDKFEQIVRELTAASETESDKKKRTKAASNLRALTDYMRHFGSRKLSIKPGKRLYYSCRQLLVSAQPDFFAEEAGRPLLIKLNLTTKDFSGGVTGLMLHVLHQAASVKGLAASVECLQVATGTRTSQPKSGFGPVSILERRVDELLALWPLVA